MAAYLHAFRAWFAERYLDDDELLWLPNDTSPMEDVVAAVTAHADGRSSPGAGTGLRRFLDDLARDAVAAH